MHSTGTVGQAIAKHLDELMEMFHTNEAILSSLNGPVCTSVLHSLTKVNQTLDLVGW